MWLFESSCVICDAGANGICDSCVDRLVSADPSGLLDISSVTTLFSYEGVGAELLQALKFKNRRAVLGTLVDALCESLPTDVDSIGAVPGHSSHSQILSKSYRWSLSRNQRQIRSNCDPRLTVSGESWSRRSTNRTLDMVDALQHERRCCEHADHGQQAEIATQTLSHLHPVLDERVRAWASARG
jgi:hypothetical protein